MNPTHPSAVDRYRRTAEFERRAANLRLRAIEWDVLFALDVQTSLADAADRCGISRDEASAIVARFENLGLVETQKLSLEEYRAQSRPPVLATAPLAAAPLAPPPALASPARVTFSLKRAVPRDEGG